MCSTASAVIALGQDIWDVCVWFMMVIYSSKVRGGGQGGLGLLSVQYS